MQTTITKSIKETITSALVIMQGDDLERAKAEFRQYSPEEMLQQHGRSGRTRQEVLDSWQQHRDRVNAAIKWVSEQTSG